MDIVFTAFALMVCHGSSHLKSSHSHGFYLDEGLVLGGKLLLVVDSTVDTAINIIKISLNQ